MYYTTEENPDKCRLYYIYPSDTTSDFQLVRLSTSKGLGIFQGEFVESTNGVLLKDEDARIVYSVFLLFVGKADRCGVLKFTSNAECPAGQERVEDNWRGLLHAADLDLNGLFTIVIITTM
ncbi:uncharacterized protein LOC144141457 isoform X1 [Haemaphysalis longicornis]